MVDRRVVIAALALAVVCVRAAPVTAVSGTLSPFSPLAISKPGSACSSIVRLADGALLTADGNSTVVSRDQGISWGERRAILVDRPALGTAHVAGVPGGTIMLLRTRDNVLVAIWRDPRVDDWDKVSSALGPNARGAVWSIRSLDGGETWVDKQLLFDGVCGHPPINLLQLATGTIVVPVQYYVSYPLRCVIRTYVSKDNGKTWHGGNTIDLGGNGHHDGALEPSLVELRDGRVWMLIRTNLDRLWEAFSDNDGLYWRTIRPTSIDASSSPPYITRLASGRLILFWNRLQPETSSAYERRGGPFSETDGSWHRAELSVALSEDEGTSWSPPRVLAREHGKWLAYSYAFEPEPGVLWLFSGQGDLALQAYERDLLADP